MRRQGESARQVGRLKSVRYTTQLALIKRKLEEHKENYRRRQGEPVGNCKFDLVHDIGQVGLVLVTAMFRFLPFDVLCHLSQAASGMILQNNRLPNL
jgi:hypothetical protein